MQPAANGLIKFGKIYVGGTDKIKLNNIFLIKI